MPWQERSSLSERQEFVAFARQEGATIAVLCRHFGISRKTGYKWLARAVQSETPLADRSRRPHASPGRTPAASEAQVLALRQQPPAPSTITAILRRHGLLAAQPAPRDFVRFEHPAPNELWQLDFMGHRPLEQDRVHPLTLLDDHSRFALTLTACANQQAMTVKNDRTHVFQHYGLPRSLLCDNGAPWAPAGMTGLTSLEAWLLQLGIEVWHGRPSHPQTQGKVERFHGTLVAEVFGTGQFPDLATTQAAFDRFRVCYNHERPHEALAYAVPASRYQPSPRLFPERLPEIVYGPDDAVRIVTVHGSIQWQHRRAFVGRGLVGQPVGVRPTAVDGVWHVFYCQRQVATIDRRVAEEV